MDKIRVKIYNSTYITELQFVSRNQAVSAVKVGAKLGEWYEHKLAKNERLTGIFGHTIHSLNDEPLQKFGLIVQ